MRDEIKMSKNSAKIHLKDFSLHWMFFFERWENEAPDLKRMEIFEKINELNGEGKTSKGCHFSRFKYTLVSSFTFIRFFKNLNSDKINLKESARKLRN